MRRIDLQCWIMKCFLTFDQRTFKMFMCFVLIVFWNNLHMKERIYNFDKECGFEKKVRKFSKFFKGFVFFFVTEL